MENITFAAQKQAFDPWNIPDSFTLYQFAPEDIRSFLHPYWHGVKAPHPVWFYFLGLYFFILGETQPQRLRDCNSETMNDPLQVSSPPSATTACCASSAARRLCVLRPTCWSWTWPFAIWVWWSLSSLNWSSTSSLADHGGSVRLPATCTPSVVRFNDYYWPLIPSIKYLAINRRSARILSDHHPDHDLLRPLQRHREGHGRYSSDLPEVRHDDHVRLGLVFRLLRLPPSGKHGCLHWLGSLRHGPYVGNVSHAIS